MSSEPCVDIHESCRRGKLVSVLEYVKGSGDIENATSRGETPLWLSCKFGHPDLAMTLVELGARITTSDDKGELALALVCQHGYLDLFKYMEEKLKTVCPEYLAEHHGQLFMAACKGGCIDMIEYVLTLVGGGDVVSALLATCEEGIEGVLHHIVRLHGVLHAACEGGSLEVVRFLIDQGANPATTSEMGQTSLHYACVGGHLGIVKYLVDLGGDCKAKDFRGLTPLHMACLQGSVEVVMYLVELGADISDQCDDGVSGLDLVCHEGHLAVVTYLVEAQKVDDINSALYAACEGGHLEVVKYLIEHGADIHFQHEFGETVLFSACQNSHLNVMKYLGQLGANLQATTSDGVSILHAAAETGDKDIVQYLVEGGARPDCRTDEGKTPLQAAFDYDHSNITIYLLQVLLKDLVFDKFQEITDMFNSEVLDANLTGKDELLITDINMDLTLLLSDNWAGEFSFRLTQNAVASSTFTEELTKNEVGIVKPLKRRFDVEILKKDNYVFVGTVCIGLASGRSGGVDLINRLHECILIRKNHPSDTILSLKNMSI